MKHFTVQSFICASVDRITPAMGANKHTSVIADRNLDKPM